jgi:hypothetical protein
LSRASGDTTIGHPHESLLEMERRHVREGEARVARQEEIVRYFDLGRNPEFALAARDLLVTFRAFLAFARERLDRLERQQRCVTLTTK